MRTVILSVNSRYIHTLLAPRYLKANCKNKDVSIYETNINVKLENVLSDMYKLKPNIIGISCYIFNIEYIRKFLKEIKVILPEVIIILGGYEVTFDSDNYLEYCDYIIKGEGDFIFDKLLEDIINKTNNFGKIIESGTVENLDDIVSPFDREYCMLGKEKILYYESSRGCPYSCSYCMSANTKSVRTFSLDRIFSDIKNIMEYQPKQIKFVDRTFNYNLEKTKKVISFIIDNFQNNNTNFHFEMAPELFDSELFELLKMAKKGLFQFEIGIQSYNSDSLKSVGRSANVEKIELNLQNLKKLSNIHIHVDLIAGLPHENLQSFVLGFNRLIKFKPDCLQLGFLKILKGSKIFYNKEGYKIFNLPPYEICSSKWITFDEIMILKDVEEVLENYYNSGRYKNTISFLFLDERFNPFNFFKKVSNYLKENKTTIKQLSAIKQSDALYEVLIKEYDEVTVFNLIDKDFLDSGNARKWRRNK